MIPGTFFLLATKKGKEVKKEVLQPLKAKAQQFQDWPYSSTLLQSLAVAVVAAFLIVDTQNSRQRLISAGGIVVLVLFGFCISKHPECIRWRQVFWGIGLQYAFGLMVLRSSTGRQLFKCLGDKVSSNQ